MKKIFGFLIVFILIFTLSFSSFASDFPKATNDFFVNDFADVISEEHEEEMMQIGADLYEQTTAQVVLVTVESLDGYEVNDYALELGREWGVGSSETNNGVVLLLSVNDRKVTIQVGYGLEGCLTDAETGSILDTYAIPYLSNDDFSTGLIEAYKAITSKVCYEYGVELNPEYEIDNYTPSETYDYNNVISSEGMGIIVGAFLIVFVIVIILGKSSGDGSNHGGGRGYHTTTYYGGFSGGSRGGFSGGGGFRGGGGSFGGGGASRGF